MTRCRELVERGDGAAEGIDFLGGAAGRKDFPAEHRALPVPAEAKLILKGSLPKGPWRSNTGW